MPSNMYFDRAFEFMPNCMERESEMEKKGHQAAHQMKKKKTKYEHTHLNFQIKVYKNGIKIYIGRQNLLPQFERMPKNFECMKLFWC
jgi:hypothetical protein